MPHPVPNGALPANDAAVHPGVALDDSVLHDGGALDADPVLDHDSRTDAHVGPYPALRPYLGSGVHQHVTDDTCGGRNRQISFVSYHFIIIYQFKSVNNKNKKILLMHALEKIQ